jgi:cell division protein FtsB
MTDVSALDAALAELRRKAAKRRDVAGYGANVEALNARIADLEAQRAAVLAQDADA